MKKKQKLSRCERLHLYKMRERGFGIREIARNLARAPSTVSRELKRNKPPGAYFRLTGYERALHAHERAAHRRHLPRDKRRIKSCLVRDYIVEKLQDGWSPELIAGRLPRDHPGQSVSHETIYQWLYREARSLIECLPRQGRKRKRRKRAYRYRHQEGVKKRNISERPQATNERKHYGDWEADTVQSPKRKKGCVYTLKERKSRFTLYLKLSECTSLQAYHACQSVLSRLPKSMRRSLTHDNGPENYFQERLEENVKGTVVYFCNPYAAQERGAVENSNGFLRRSYPKGTDFSLVSQSHLSEIHRKYNHRPMKCLNYQTPYEVLSKEFEKEGIAEPALVFPYMG